MKIIKSLELQDVVYFKTAKVQLDRNPITFIRGSNLDADKARPTSNGAGKTLLFSTIPNIAYFSPPLAIRRKAKKELLSTKKSKIALEVQGEHNYVIEQTSSKYTIYKNGKDLKIRTAPLAEQYIRTNIFDLPEIEFYHTQYISTQKPFPLQTDTNINRLEHLIKIFRLDYYDKIRKYFQTKIGDIETTEAKVSILLSKRQNLVDQVKLNTIKYDEVKLKKLKKSLSTILDKLDEYSRLEENTKLKINTLTHLYTIEKKLDKLRGEYEYNDSPSTILVYLKQQKSLIKSYEAYKDNLEVYNKQLSKLTSQLDKLKKPEHDLDELKKRIKYLNSKRVDLSLSIKTAEECRTTLKNLKSKIKELKASLGDVSFDMSVDYEQQLHECNLTLKLKSLLHKDKCPTCLSEIDESNVKLAVRRAEKRLPIITKALKTKEKILKLEELKKELGKVDFDKEKYESYLRTKLDAELELSELEAKLENIQKYARLTSSLKDLVKPKRPQKPELDITYDDCEEQIDLCNSILEQLTAKSKLLKSNDLEEFKTVVELKKVIRECETDLEELSNKLLEIRNTQVELSRELEEQNTYKNSIDLYSKELEKLDKEISTLKEKSDDKIIYKELAKAYSNKGLKSIVANKICHILEQNLNEYRHLLFYEPFEFFVKSSDKGLDIVVDRRNNKVSDVRNLSGAESNSFRMLMMLSMFSLIPDERRFNMCVLDEPSAHSDEVSRNLFLTSFLPVLQECVPNIYVISPNPTDFVEGASEWLVKKQKGVSTVLTLS